jgi:phosphatidylglycerophosphatase A
MPVAGRGTGRLTSRLILLVAQGFGAGCIRLAPGTFGSLLGLLWFLALVWPRHLGVFAVGTLGGVLVSVWVCGAAERLLNRTDPPSVVLDEMVAMPLCYAGWAVWEWSRTGALPPPEFYLTGPGWWGTAGLFVAFRFVDVVKPWPVGRSQRLSGGWGVTLDDVLAACYVNLGAALLWILVG